MKEEMKLGTTLRKNVKNENIKTNSSGTTKEKKNTVNSVLQQNLVSTSNVPSNKSHFRKSLVNDSTQEGLLITAISNEGRPASLYLPQNKNESKLNDVENENQEDHFVGKRDLNCFSRAIQSKEASASKDVVLAFSSNQETRVAHQENYNKNSSGNIGMRFVIIFKQVANRFEGYDFS